MKKNNRRNFPPPDLKTFHGAPNDNERNRLLLEWLSDGDARVKLFEEISKAGGSLAFPSRDNWQRDCDHCGLDGARADVETGLRPARLITDRSQIIKVLLDDGTNYSNRVYAELGGGSFMLALDPKSGGAHKAQRAAYAACFPKSRDVLVELGHHACQAASIMGLKRPDFDLAVFAEQAAVRFCQKLLGYSLVDYTLLERTLGAGYRGLVYQVMGRHFTTDPTAVPEARQAMGRLLARTGALIDAYATEDKDALKGCKDLAVPTGFKPVMEQLAAPALALNGEQLAVIAVGAAVGTVGNVQAAACIAVKAMFADRRLWKVARKLAMRESGRSPTRRFRSWQRLIQQALRDDPPIPFLPRIELLEGSAIGDVLLALGGGTRDASAPHGDDPLIWGLPPPVAPAGTHWCAGQALAWPLVVEIVRQVMRLPGLAERLDPEDASVIGLKQRWGFACESYPLTHQRERRVAQSSLNVAMRLRSPVKDNADRVREVIRSGAPRIEEALRGSRHVHFAWFELIESDTVLVLHTVYDGPFSAYIQHFALKVGDLFDELFQCIETPPPMPVDKFPSDFVAHIQRFNRAPASGYFFSAYPGSDVAQILRDELARL